MNNYLKDIIKEEDIKNLTPPHQWGFLFPVYLSLYENRNK